MWIFVSPNKFAYVGLPSCGILPDQIIEFKPTTCWRCNLTRFTNAIEVSWILVLAYFFCFSSFFIEHTSHHNNHVIITFLSTFDHTNAKLISSGWNWFSTLPSVIFIFYKVKGTRQPYLRVPQLYFPNTHNTDKAALLNVQIPQKSLGLDLHTRAYRRRYKTSAGPASSYSSYIWTWNILDIIHKQKLWKIIDCFSRIINSL